MFPKQKISALFYILSTARLLNASKKQEKSCNPNEVAYDENGEITRNCEKVDNAEDPFVCKLFVAESSIPNAGLGIYSGVDVSPNDIVSDFDLPIQVLDFELHHPDLKEWLLDSYFWQSSTVGSQNEAHQVEVTLPSFGMLANSHLGLRNVEMDDIKPRLTYLHRSRDPGAGALTNYSPTDWRATQFIAEGGEIFVDYGENYFTTRLEKYGPVPLYDDYDVAMNVLKKFLDIAGETSEGDMSVIAKQSMWDLIREVSTPRTRSALPVDASSLKNFKELGSTASHNIPNAIRSIEWLKKHGQCIDNIGVKRSTVPQAGQGAFAKTTMPKGSVILTTPLIQIHNKHHLDMYEVEYKSNQDKPTRTENEDVVGKQLLLNYCFGHSNSSLLLFPYSPVVNFINHNSGDYNAEIRWSVHKYHNSAWLEMPIDELPIDYSGLMIDVVATRDIAFGEEVFLNYGSEWDEAWNRHVHEWSPVEGAGEYEHSDDSSVYRNSFVLTVEEQKTTPYPSNLETACYFRYYSNYDYPAAETGEDGKETKFEFEWNDDDGEISKHYLKPCDVLDRYIEDSTVRYNVLLHNSAVSDDEGTIPSNVDFVVLDMPGQSITLVDDWYSTDQSLKNAFRHPVGVPEGLYPPLWLNREA